MAERPNHLRLVCSVPGNSLAEIASEFSGSVVTVDGEPLPDLFRQRPPLKPRRPAAAVRKSLRAALAASAAMVDTVRSADARTPAKARRTVQELQAHSKRISNLVGELHHAVECEARYHLWLRGSDYVE